MAEEQKVAGHFQGRILIKCIEAKGLDPKCAGAHIRCIFSGSHNGLARSGLVGLLSNSLSFNSPEKKKVNTQLMTVTEALDVKWESYLLQLNLETDTPWLKIRLEDNHTHKHGMACIPLNDETLQSTLDEPLTIPLEPLGTISIALQFQRAGSMFGMPLVELCRKEEKLVPRIVQQCVGFLERYGLQHPGIFRISGSKIEVNRLRDNFDKYPVTLVSEKAVAEDEQTSKAQVDNISNLFKTYLRELPGGLLPPSVVSPLLALKSLPDRAAEQAALAAVLQELSQPAVATFRFVIEHLHEVARHKEENNMNAYNLAVCLAPSLIPETVKVNEAIPAIAFLIENSKLFAELSATPHA